MISDRLESLLDAGAGAEMLSLGLLLKRSKGRISAQVWASIHEWRQQRNDVLHQMVKYGPGFPLAWRERVALAHATAVSGVLVVRLCDAEVRKAKRVDGTLAASPTLGP